jgi:hypothetical protein
MDFIMVLRDETLRKLGVNLSDDFMLNLEKMLEIVKQNTFKICFNKETS